MSSESSSAGGSRRSSPRSPSPFCWSPQEEFSEEEEVMMVVGNGGGDPPPASPGVGDVEDARENVGSGSRRGAVARGHPRRARGAAGAGRARAAVGAGRARGAVGAGRARGSRGAGRARGAAGRGRALLAVGRGRRAEQLRAYQERAAELPIEERGECRTLANLEDLSQLNLSAAYNRPRAVPAKRWLLRKVLQLLPELAAAAPAEPAPLHAAEISSPSHSRDVPPQRSPSPSTAFSPHPTRLPASNRRGLDASPASLAPSHSRDHSPAFHRPPHVDRARPSPTATAGTSSPQPSTSGTSRRPSTTPRVRQSRAPSVYEQGIVSRGTSLTRDDDVEYLFGLEDSEPEESDGEDYGLQTRLPRTERDVHLDEDGDTAIDNFVREQDAAVAAELETRDINLQPFNWQGDFRNFHSTKEVFRGRSGPTDAGRSTDEFKCFQNIWDEEIMSKLVEFTNKYGEYLQASSEQIAAEFNHDAAQQDGTRTRPKVFKWKPTNVEEMYRLFKVFIIQSVYNLGNELEYFYNKLKEVQFTLGDIVPFTRFKELKRCLRFADLQMGQDLSPHDKKMFKIAPIVNHCNKKFKELYDLDQNIAIDESLTLCKGKLTFRQFIRTKAARFGVKSYELCESKSGYLYAIMLYTGANCQLDERAPIGRERDTLKTVAIVLDLMDTMLDKGHVLFMDNFYNCPELARHLKSRGTDCVGTLLCKRKSVPSHIKLAKAAYMKLGDQIALHTGDVSVISWMDKRKVTMISTYHSSETSIVMQKGKQVAKPVVVLDYNENMGGVDLKHQRLSSFLMERNRNLKWTMKMFKRLLNTSILNALIIFSASAGKQTDHQEFRYAMLGGLDRYVVARRGAVALAAPLPVQGVAGQNVAGGEEQVQARPKRKSYPQMAILDRPIFPRAAFHCPVFILNARGGKTNASRCVVCSSRNIVRRTTYSCRVCKLNLCMPDCFDEYHTSERWQAGNSE